MGDLSVPVYEPGFESVEERLRTFIDCDWPPGAPVAREALARAGFIYNGENLAVQCFSCNVTCRDWNFGDIAIRKHRQLNPNCPFVVEQADIFLDRSEPMAARRSEASPAPGHNQTGDHIWVRPIKLQDYMHEWPNHEILVKESERLKTYAEGWPLDFVRPEDLARAGFVYLRRDDRVQCIFCYGILGDWERGDVPFQEHCRHFASCPFVRGQPTRNVSLKCEIREMQIATSFPAESHRGFDVCGSLPMDMNSFRPEREEAVSPAYDLEQLNIIEHLPPKHQEYATRAARFKSFESWPKNAPQYVNALVDAGFFFTGTNDHVKCFQCGGGLKNWESTDVPDEEHARWHPTCSFVLLNKGKEYIERSKKLKPPVLGEAESVPMQIPAAVLPRSGNAIGDGELENLMGSDVAKAVLDMGMDRCKVRQAIRIRWQRAGYNFANAESLANAVLELDDFGISGMEDQQSAPNNGEVALSEVASTSATNLAKGFEGLKGEDPQQDTAASVSGLATARVVGTEQEFRLCKVCMEQEICIVFLPCGHFVACVNCATSMRDCPLCRANIKGSVRMYWP